MSHQSTMLEIFMEGPMDRPGSDLQVLGYQKVWQGSSNIRGKRVPDLCVQYPRVNYPWVTGQLTRKFCLITELNSWLSGSQMIWASLTMGWTQGVKGNESWELWMSQWGWQNNIEGLLAWVWQWGITNTTRNAHSWGLCGQGAFLGCTWTGQWGQCTGHCWLGGHWEACQEQKTCTTWTQDVCLGMAGSMGSKIPLIDQGYGRRRGPSHSKELCSSETRTSQ